MSKKSLISTLLLLSFTSNQLIAHAAGPLVVKNGKAITYGTRALTYRYDQGTLGKLSNTEITNIIESLFASWVNLTSSDVKFQKDSPGSLDFDVTDKNFDSILNSQELLGYSPIIFDTDGKLLDAFLGSGAGKSVLGLAGPITVSSGQFANQIAESQGVFNGKFINGIDSSSDPESSEDSLKGTILHEFGHAFGLDHSQINVESIKSGSTQEVRDSVPLMFPIAVNDLFTIQRDDQSAAASLYPNSSTASNFGKIEGKLLRSDGKTVVLGGNVIAKSVNNPILEAVSCVSDYLANSTGTYSLEALPPGDYTIEIEPIDLSFTGGSGVGPYSASKTDKSFVSPVPNGYYTGPNLPITTDKSKALIVSVSAGQTISGANIIASTTASTSSSSSSSSSGIISQLTEIEPNDSIAEAQNISIPAAISGNASSSDGGELELTSDTGAMIVISDLYQVVLNGTTSFNANLSIDSSSQQDDLDLVLFNSNGSQILDTSSQNGNTDELISTTLDTGTYLIGVGAFAGSSTYKLDINSSSGSTSNPTVTLSGSDTIFLNPSGMNFIQLTANGSNFTGMTPCSILTSNSTLLMSKPSRFMLGPIMTQKVITVKVPLIQAVNLISNGSSEVVTVSISCGNQTSDEKDILLSPNSFRTLNRKWRIKP
jgi:hypothetical protein